MSTSSTSAASSGCGLQIPVDFELQRRAWRFERIGWLVMGLVLLAAALGLFGRGLFSTATAVCPSGRLSIDYPRAWRIQSPLTLTLRLDPAPSSPTVQLWIEDAFLARAALEQITPPPERVTLGGGRLTYSFGVGPDPGPAVVEVRISPELPGPLPWRLGLAGEPGVRFSQFIHP